MSIDLNTCLNSEQAAAAGNIQGPSLIIAGAGSGKTRMITYRIAYMLENGIDEKEILALTFTNKAAREMSDRIKSLTGRPLKGLTMSTFHSFGLKLLKQYIQYLGYKNNFTLYDTIDNMNLIKEVIISLGLEADEYNLYTMLSLFSDVKTGRIKPFEDKNSAASQIYTEWLLSQKAYNVVDFDDLILLPIRLFEKRPDILDAVQDRYRYIMVDEFQDTSLLQYRFVSMIAGKYHNICVVGDDDQSIYSWRGANYRNIIEFESDFPERKEYKLERNYRSTGHILEAANNLIVHNKERKEKKLWTDDEQGSMIYLISPENEEDEAYLIAEGIKKRHNDKNIPYSEFGVLVRTNSQIQYLENALTENGLSVAVSGGESFFEKKEVRDILSYVRLLINSDDDISFLRIINTPRRGIGRTTIEKLRAYADSRKIHLFDAMTEFAYAADSPVKDKPKAAIKKLSDDIVSWQNQVKNCNYSSLISAIIDSIGYKEMLYNDYKDKPKQLEFKLKTLEFLLSRIARFQYNNPDLSLSDYLNLISLDSKDEDETSQKQVNLMTMHSSKGLEFDTVYLAGVEDNIIPLARSLEENMKNIDEERRLFYVAITRARKQLVISHCQNRRDRTGNSHIALPSRFLEEIPSSLFTDEAEDFSQTNEDRISMLNDLLSRFSH